jgi:hypothetical protein
MNFFNFYWPLGVHQEGTYDITERVYVQRYRIIQKNFQFLYTKKGSFRLESQLHLLEVHVVSWQQLLQEL